MFQEPLTQDEYDELMKQLREMVFSEQNTGLFTVSTHGCFHYYNFSLYSNTRMIPVKAFHAIRNITYQCKNLKALCDRTGLNYEKTRQLIKTNGPYLTEDGWQLLPGKTPDSFCRLYHPKIHPAKFNPW